MQKKLMTLAIAGLSTTAFAQSATNVTIYGVVDVSGQGFSIQKGSGNAKSDTPPGPQGNVFALSNNTSLLGFRGTEDLGGGLQAIFQAESWLNITGQGTTGVSNYNTAANTGSASAFGTLRDSYVGLQGNFGSIKGGYNSTPLRASLVSFDVMPGVTGSGAIESLMGKLRLGSRLTDKTASTAATQFGASIRATSVVYALPTLYGFNGSIAYTGSNNDGLRNGQTSGTTPQSVFGFNLGWTGYGVNVQGAYQKANNNLAVLPNSTDTGYVAPTGYVANSGGIGDYTSYLLGASYTGVPGLKLATVYMRNQLAGAGSLSGSKLKSNLFWLGASYRFGNWEPHVSAVWSGNVNGSSDLDARGGNQLGARQWTANLSYYLSKRTQVYGLVSQLQNSANQNFGFNSSPSNLTPTGGQSSFTYGMGVRHTF